MTFGFWFNNLPVEKTGMTVWEWFLSLFSRPKPAPQPVPSPIPEPIVRLFDAANAARNAYSLPPFLPDPKLDAAAQLWAASMAAKDRLEHGDFRGRLAAIYPNRAAAENVAYDPGDAHAVVLDWLGSPPHKRDLLGPYVRVGCGHAGNYWVLDLLGDGPP